MTIGTLESCGYIGHWNPGILEPWESWASESRNLEPQEGAWEPHGFWNPRTRRALGARSPRNHK